MPHDCAYRYTRRPAPNHDYAAMHIWRTVPDAELVTDDLTRNERNVYSLGLVMKSLGVRYIQTAADAEDSVSAKSHDKRPFPHLIMFFSAYFQVPAQKLSYIPPCKKRDGN